MGDGVRKPKLLDQEMVHDDYGAADWLNMSVVEGVKANRGSGGQ